MYMSHCHLHGNLLVWGVALKSEVLKHEGVNILLLRVDVQHLHGTSYEHHTAKPLKPFSAVYIMSAGPDKHPD